MVVLSVYYATIAFPEPEGCTGCELGQMLYGALFTFGAFVGGAVSGAIVRPERDLVPAAKRWSMAGGAFLVIGILTQLGR